MKTVITILSLFASVAFAAEKTADVGVRFLQPKNGDIVGTKFKVKMGVKGYTVAPVGASAKGQGHHHLIINGSGVPAGKIVPADDTHIHFGKGQTETELELKPGKYSLTLQFADGTHTSYGPAVSETIEVVVVETVPKKK